MNQPAAGSPAYLAGLVLAGRRVVVVGGGAVAARRVPNLVAADADVVLVAPTVDASLRQAAGRGEVTWHERGYASGDLQGAWYVLAATDDPTVNAEVATDAEVQHTFCVRADDATGGSAWTPATAHLDGATVGVLTNRDPRRAKALRDRLRVVLAGTDAGGAA